MKKVLSVFLAVLMIFLVCNIMFASAEEITPAYTVTFADYDGTIISTQTVAQGGIVKAPENPTRADTEECTYIFKGWDGGDGVLYHATTLPRVTGDVTYIAVYSESKIEEGITLMGLIRSIFARINAIFEYFYRLFNRVGNDDGYEFP